MLSKVKIERERESEPRPKKNKSIGGVVYENCLAIDPKN